MKKNKLAQITSFDQLEGECSCGAEQKNPNMPFYKIHNLARKIADLSREAAMTDNEKKRDKYMNKIIDLAEAMEEVYTCNWH